MKHDEFRQYCNLILSMTTKVLSGTTTRETFLFNLKVIIKKLEEGIIKTEKVVYPDLDTEKRIKEK